MNRRRFTGSIVCFIFATTLFVHAQRVPDKELASLRQRYFSGSPVSMKIKVSQIEKGGDTISVEYGDFYLKGSRFRIDFGDQVIVYDGKWLYTYTAFDSQLVVEAFDTTSALRLIYDVISGDLSRFYIRSIERLKGFRIYRLDYKFREVFYKDIGLEVNEGSGEVSKVEFKDFDDTLYCLDVLGVSYQEVEESFFDLSNFRVKERVDLSN